MPDDAPHLPDDPSLPSFASLVPLSGLPVALQIFFDQTMFERCKSIARYMADAKGFIPGHLAGNPSACFAVMSRALTWKLDPFAVAQATYEVGGRVGYYGSLCQAILESSGRLEGGVKFRHYGDWSKIMRRFKMVANQGGRGTHPEPDWPAEAEDGVGVEVIAQIKGESAPRTLEFDLAQAYPRNSVLWATDPKTQIQYTAVRRFANTVAPTLFMGVPFDRDEIEGWAASMKDVTPPRPRREDFAGNDAVHADARVTDAKPEPLMVADHVGELTECTDTEDAAARFRAELDFAEKQRGDLGVSAVWENNARLIYDLREQNHGAIADELAAYYAERMAAAQQAGEEVREDNRRSEPGVMRTEQTQDNATVPAKEGAEADPQPAAAAARSLAVPIRQGSRQGTTDWPGTAQDMIEAIAKLTDPADTEPNGRFKQDNRRTLDTMRISDKNAWSTVEYRLGDRYRQLRGGGL